MNKSSTTSRRSKTRKGGQPVAPPHPLPTLARLSFHVPPERMGEFATGYEAKVVPILKAHGLVESSERGRATPAHIFSRLFEVKTPSEVAEKREALQKDAAWQKALRDLRTASEAGGPIQHRFELYTTPAGPGKTVFSVSGKTRPAGSGRGHWRTYDATDGLIGGSVFSIFQDREGYLWFSTRGSGVRRYDGQDFTPFTTKDGLANNNSWRILQDREGNLWFGTHGGGVSRYDGRDWVTFTTKDGLASNDVRSILQDQEGYLWFGTDGGGVSRYDGKTWTTFTTQDGLANNDVRSIVQDREGNLWFGTGGGVSRYDGQTPSTGSGHSFTTFTTKDGLAGNIVWSILQDLEGNLWFGIDGGGVSRYDGQDWVTFTTKDGLANNDVISILQDQEENLWFGTHGGVSRYDGQDWTTFTIADGLATNLVWSIFQDREGYLWFGTSGGVSRYEGQALTTFTLKDGMPDNVFWILQDREGHLWFSSQGGGVSRYDGQDVITFTTHEGLPDNVVQPIFQDREGYLWFGTIGGLCRYDRQNLTTFTTQDGLIGDHIQGIFQDRDGYLWFGTLTGVSRYDGQTFTTFTTADGLAHNYVWTTFQDREGYLWFGTAGGISRYDGGFPSTRSTSSGQAGSELALPVLSKVEGSETKGQTFTTFTTQDGLAGGMVISISQDREEHLWFGSYNGGVSRYDGERFITFTPEDGLAGTGIRSILQDQQGHLWFGTSGGGVSRYDGQVFQALTRQDGLTGNVVFAIFQDPEGDLWFGTSGGLTRYRPSAPSSPPAFIDAVVADRRYEGVAELEVPAFVKLTAFEFHGMSLKTRPDAMVYRYRLKGYEEAWRNTRERRVEYEDLPVGEYAFEVVAVDRDLVYSEKPATVRLRVVQDTRDAQIDDLERRVRARTQELQASNRALSDANKDLFSVNRALQASNRRLERDRAVDRVQAEVAAMRTSADLERVTPLVWKELTGLGVPFFRCGVFLVDEEERRVRTYLTNPQGASLAALNLPFGSHPHINRVMVRWRAGEVHVEQWDRQAFLDYAQFLQAQGQAIERERYLDAESPPERLVLQFAPFAHGMLYVGSAEALPEGDIDLVKSLADAFSVAYARYRDFQQLETQNRALGQALDEKERAQRQLIQAERMVAVGELVAGSAHELNNPLAVASSMMQSVGEILKEDTPEELLEDRRLMTENVRLALKDLGRVKEIVANLLSLSDRTRDYTEAVQINIVADDAVRLLRGKYDAERVRIVKEYGQDLPTVTGNFADLGQMGMHLVRNAVEALKGAGTITLRTAFEDSQIVFECHDTGAGIPPEIRGEIFKPFFKTKPPAEGTGLGLYIVHRIVEKHGGGIEVDSATGKGTTFRVRLPLTR